MEGCWWKQNLYALEAMLFQLDLTTIIWALSAMVIVEYK